MDPLLLKKAIQLNKTGKREEARKMLIDIVSEQPENLTAWLWLVDTMDSNHDRVTIIHQAEKFHPNHPQLKQALKQFETDQASDEQARSDTHEPKPQSISTEPAQQTTTPEEDTETIKEEDNISTDIQDENPADNFEGKGKKGLDKPEPLSTLRKKAIEEEKIRVKTKISAHKKQKSTSIYFFLILFAIITIIIAGILWLKWQFLIFPTTATKVTNTATLTIESTNTSEFSPTPPTAATQTSVPETEESQPTETPQPSLTLTQESFVPTATSLLAATITPTPAVPEGLFVSLEGETFYDLAWSSNGTYFALAASSGLLIFDGRTFELVQHITVDPPLPVRAITFSDDETLIAGGFDSSATGEEFVTRAKLWNVIDGAEIASFNYNQARGDVDQLAISIDNETLWMNAKYDQIIKWRISDGTLLDVYEFSSSAVDYYNVVFAPDRRSFARYSIYDRIRIFDSAIGEQITTLGTEKNAIHLVYSPNNQYLASTYEKSSFIVIWDIPAKRELRTINTYEESINTLCFNPFNRIIAAATSDDLIKFFDLNSGEELRVISRQITNVNQMAFSPDDTRLAMRNNKDVQIWALQTDKLLATFRLSP